MTVING